MNNEPIFIGTGPQRLKETRLVGQHFEERGIPITQFEVGGKPLQQQGLYFSMNYRLF
jgi:hypothetical protein